MTFPTMMFIPHHLAIKNHPEFNIFSLNVLFAKYTVINGKVLIGTASYKPDLTSYRKRGNKHRLSYYNVHGGNNWLVIEYDSVKQTYLGKKFVNEKYIGEAVGPDWKMFFVHLTLLGLSNGERCEFEEVK